MSLPPLTGKVIDDLAASMQAASERMEAQTARIAELEQAARDCMLLLEHWKETVAAVEVLADTTVRGYQHSTPFRHLCKAEMKRRGLT